MNADIEKIIKENLFDKKFYSETVDRALENARNYSTIFYKLIFKNIIEQYVERLKNRTLVEKGLLKNDPDYNNTVYSFKFDYCIRKDELRYEDIPNNYFHFCDNFFKERNFDTGTTGIEFTNYKKLIKTGIEYHATGQQTEATDYIFPVDSKYLINLFEEDGFNCDTFGNGAIEISIEEAALEELINSALNKEKEEVYSKNFKQDYNEALSYF